MENFQKQMIAAIGAYSEISGLPVSEVTELCKDQSGSVFRSVTMIMFAAR